MYVKVYEAATMLSVKEETIRRYIRSGLLKAVKINKHYLIKKSDITDFMQTNMAGSLDLSKDMLKDILNQVDDIRNKHPEEIERLKKEQSNKSTKNNIDDVIAKILKSMIPDD